MQLAVQQSWGKTAWRELVAHRVMISVPKQLVVAIGDEGVFDRLLIDVKNTVLIALGPEQRPIEETWTTYRGKHNTLFVDIALEENVKCELLPLVVEEVNQRLVEGVLSVLEGHRFRVTAHFMRTVTKEGTLG